MKQRGIWIIVGVLVLIISGVALVMATNTTPQTEADVDAPPAMIAPQPRTPAADLTFVESDINLSWEWSPALNENQSYAVRVWYEDAQPREAWIKEDTFNAAEFIDSFSQDVGTYHWQVAVVNHSDAGFEGMGSEWSDLQTLHRVRRLPLEPLPLDRMSPAARMIHDERHETATQTIDAVREFVYHNALDKRQRDYEADYSDAIQIMYEYAQGNSDEQPYLQCDGRSGSMFTLLQELGIESRLILLYGHDENWISQHTFLEVFNPDTQQWEVHDGLYGIYLYDEIAGERASVERAVFGEPEGMVACNAAGDCNTDLYDHVDGYLMAFRYGYDRTFWVNPDRFDLSKRFSDHGGVNLAEFLTGNPRDVTIRIGTWDGF